MSDNWEEVEGPDAAAAQKQITMPVPGTTIAKPDDNWESVEGPAIRYMPGGTSKSKIPEKMKEDQGGTQVVPDWLAKILPAQQPDPEPPAFMKRWFGSPKADTVNTNPLTMLKALGEHTPFANQLTKPGDEDLARAHQDYPKTTMAANIAGPVLGMGAAGEGLASGMAAKGMTGFAPTMLSQGTMNAAGEVGDRALKQARGFEQNPTDYLLDLIKSYGAAGIGAGIGTLAGRSSSEASNVARENASNYANQSSKVKEAREGLTGYGGPPEGFRGNNMKDYVEGNPTSEVGDIWGTSSGKANTNIDKMRDVAEEAGSEFTKRMKANDFNKQVYDNLIKDAETKGEGTFPGIDPIVETLKKKRAALENPPDLAELARLSKIAQEGHGAIRAQYEDLNTVAGKATVAKHPEDVAARNAGTLRNLQEGGTGAALGYLGGLGSHGLVDPFTAAAFGGAIPATYKMGLHAYHALGVPERASQLFQSKSGPAMMNAAIMAALRDDKKGQK